MIVSPEGFVFHEFWMITIVYDAINKKTFWECMYRHCFVKLTFGSISLQICLFSIIYRNMFIFDVSSIRFNAWQWVTVKNIKIYWNGKNYECFSKNMYLIHPPFINPNWRANNQNGRHAVNTWAIHESQSILSQHSRHARLKKCEIWWDSTCALFGRNVLSLSVRGRLWMKLCVFFVVSG